MKDMEGTVVDEKGVTTGLGFASVEEFRAWQAEGAPTGRCSNRQCWRPAFWPHLDLPCRYCGAAVTVDRAKDPGASAGSDR